MSNLEKRGIAVNNACLICKLGEETTIHALWTCNKAKVVRKEWMSRNAKRIGIGVLIQNYRGVVMASCAQFMVGNFDSIVAGIVAMFKGVLFSLDCGLQQCIYESNKTLVVNRISDGELRFASYGHILDEINMLKKNNSGMSFRATIKAANRATHWLPKLGRDSSCNKFWMEDMPRGIRNLVKADWPM
ncbi:hypothetical protein Ddye_003675 [Dipteronia dyeriana]|uniref:RNase H type-1 domain-containing protein n=1 Tax=Dipteronia dyeriana TaxID=168575 RepID=A0AAD9XSP7_9ROSI|nr:hypothetical protein Ddye_003675 [Dipteronia dyeriana]